MTFVNVAMLMGLAGAAIPVLIHLMGHREPRRVEFPAIRFLATKLEVNRRRLNVQRWLLLALRAALIGMVVLALAQPRISGRFGAAWISIGGLWGFALLAAGLAWLAKKSGKSNALIGGFGVVALLGLVSGGAWATFILRAPAGPVRYAAAEAAVAIVVDNSVRLLYRDGDTDRLEQAKQTAGWLLGEFPITSRMAILDRSARPAAFALDSEAARRTLDGIAAVSVEDPLDRRLEAAIRLVRSSELPHRAVYVITDLAAVGWDAANAERLQDLLAEEPKVTVQIIDVGGPSDDNWRIQNLQLPAQPVTAGVPIQISVDPLRADRDQSREAQMELLVYDNQLPVFRAGIFDLPALAVKDRHFVRANSEGPVLLDLPPMDPGVYRGWVRIDSGDPLAVDDQIPWVIEVAEAPKVLIVATEAVERETMAIVFADPDSAANEFAVTVSSEADVAKRNLTEFDAVVWLDPASLTGPIAAWIQNGGQAVVALGARWTEGKPGGATLPFHTLLRWRVPEPGTYFDLVQPDFPPLRNLVGGEVPWPNYPVKIYWQLELEQAVVAPIRYAGTGHPALIDFAWNEGRVLLLTTPVPGLTPEVREWNKLLSGGDAWPTWLLLRQALGMLARPDRGTLNNYVGSPVYLPQNTTDPGRYQLIPPSLSPAAIEPSGNSVIPGAPLDVGMYWLLAGAKPRGYTARLREDQTDLRRLNPALLEKWFGKEHYSLAKSRDEVRWAEGDAASGQPLYAQAMLAAVLIWMFEHVLANRFYKRGS
jgi:hypothetical protein